MKPAKSQHCLTQKQRKAFHPCHLAAPLLGLVVLTTGCTTVAESIPSYSPQTSDQVVVKPATETIAARPPQHQRLTRQHCPPSNHWQEFSPLGKLATNLFTTVWSLSLSNLTAGLWDQLPSDAGQQMQLQNEIRYQELLHLLRNERFADHP